MVGDVVGGWDEKKGGEEGEGLAADGNPEPPFLTQTRRGGRDWQRTAIQNLPSSRKLGNVPAN